MAEIDVVASSWKTVEVGRVVLFTRGEYTGRLAAIVEIVDHKRVCHYSDDLLEGFTDRDRLLSTVLPSRTSSPVTPPLSPTLASLASSLKNYLVVSVTALC